LEGSSVRAQAHQESPRSTVWSAISDVKTPSKALIRGRFKTWLETLANLVSDLVIPRSRIIENACGSPNIADGAVLHYGGVKSPLCFYQAFPVPRSMPDIGWLSAGFSLV
jgi:hypothetical protein